MLEKLALGSKKDLDDLIRRFGSDRNPHQWYLLKSTNTQKGGLINTFLGVTIVLKSVSQKTSI